ncbi:MAG: hypothetical protein AAB840_00695 [Patescibacteria group bacterium]
MEKITIEDFKKIEMKIGEILEASKMEGSEKLLILKVDFNEEVPRQILSGISQYFENPDDLVGRQVVFVTNLAPREMMGKTSDGMILATSGDFGLALLCPSIKVPNGVVLK